jgi:hypothetical protein
MDLKTLTAAPQKPQSGSPEYMKLWKQSNAYHVRIYNREWREKHKAQLKAYKRAYYLAHKEHILAQRANYHAKHYVHKARKPGKTKEQRRADQRLRDKLTKERKQMNCIKNLTEEASLFTAFLPLDAYPGWEAEVVTKSKSPLDILIEQEEAA